MALDNVNILSTVIGSEVSMFPLYSLYSKTDNFISQIVNLYQLIYRFIA